MPDRTRPGLTPSPRDEPPGNPFEAPGAPVGDGRPMRRWRVPGPLAVLAVAWVGMGLGVLMTLDGNLGKGPVASYGFPFPYRHVAKEEGAKDWFSPGLLAVDLAIVTLMLVASGAVAQRASRAWGVGRRFSIGWGLAILGLVAFVLTGPRAGLFILVYFTLVAGFFYGAASPIIWLAIFLRDSSRRASPDADKSGHATEPPAPPRGVPDDGTLPGSRSDTR